MVHSLSLHIFLSEKSSNGGYCGGYGGKKGPLVVNGRIRPDMNCVVKSPGLAALKMENKYALL